VRTLNIAINSHNIFLQISAASSVIYSPIPKLSSGYVGPVVFRVDLTQEIASPVRHQHTEPRHNSKDNPLSAFTV
jgi:hypothetical protein